MAKLNNGKDLTTPQHPGEFILTQIHNVLIQMGCIVLTSCVAQRLNPDDPRIMVIDTDAHNCLFIYLPENPTTNVLAVMDTFRESWKWLAQYNLTKETS